MRNLEGLGGAGAWILSVFCRFLGFVESDPSEWPSPRLAANARIWLLYTYWETYAVDRLSDGTPRPFYMPPSWIAEDLYGAVARHRARGF